MAVKYPKSSRTARDVRASIKRHDNAIAAQWLERAILRNPSTAEPARGRSIDPQSPEGRAIAERLAKQPSAR